MKPSLLLIVTASIAAPKALVLLNALKELGYRLEIVLTNSAKNFLSLQEVKKITAREPFSDLFSKEEMHDMQHINLTRNADLVLVYPATANFINKISNGLADDLASSTVLACNKEICLAPAMNLHMWESKVTQDSLEKLGRQGVKILGPESGKLACGEEGLGRLVEPHDMVSFIEGYFAFAKYIKGRTILVTAGATIEPLDPVRYISNFSSGKQGVKIACYFKDLGANVILVKGKTDCLVRQDLNVVNVNTAQEMHDAVFSNLPAYMVVCAAAVADYRPDLVASDKIKKQKGEMVIKLVLNPDILKDLGHAKDRPEFLIGFAAESQDLEKNALKKLKEKKCDLIIANDISSGKIFGKDNTSVSFYDKSGKVSRHQEINKSSVASLMLEFLYDGEGR